MISFPNLHAPSIRPVILGTAGHIDHGKTALVKKISGYDTDRLPEEKRRGITIELGFAPLTIGLCLTLIHLISIPVTNTSVNPARSTGPALFVGGWAIGQLWLFWVAPILGAALAGIVYPILAKENK